MKNGCTKYFYEVQIRQLETNSASFLLTGHTHSPLSASECFSSQDQLPSKDDWSNNSASFTADINNHIINNHISMSQDDLSI